METSHLLKLGLIGDNIAASQAPRLHRLAGAQCQTQVQYDRLVPRELGMDFDGVFAWAAREGYAGLNITYPYKERAASKVSISDPKISVMGAVNTVLFRDEGAEGYNTDFTGFMAAYHAARPGIAPGTCCLIGTGGVGRAMAFALAALGTKELRLVDKDTAKADQLAQDISGIGAETVITVAADAVEAVEGSSGILNATPVGMVGYEGRIVPPEAFDGAEWAFDAVYTPVDTHFLQDASAAGVEIISGYELFFNQGVHAWKLFSGRPIDENRLRAELSEKEKAF